MAVQLINIGNVANDGTGDDLREAFIKANANFEELDLRDDEQTSVSNLGDIGEGLFAQKLVYDLQFKKLSAGANVTLTSDASKIVIATDSGVSDLTITADTGNVVLDDSAVLTISGGADISTAIAGGVLTVAYTGVTDLVSDLTPQLSADLDAQAKNLLNVGTITTSGLIGSVTGNVVGDITSTGTSAFTTVNINGGAIDGTTIGLSTPQTGSFTTLSASSGIVGDITGLVHGIDVRSITVEDNLDLGGIATNINSGIQFFLSTNGIDHGTISAAGAINSDFGTFA